MRFTYPALVHNDPEGIWLEFPDLAGCQTYGETMDDLLSNAAEALECYVVEELEHSGKLPTPSDIHAIHAEGQDFTTLVQIDADLAKHSKSVKKTLTIPYWLNEKATSVGVNFSQVLQEALIAKLA
jgi:predicted RNase H-like HicB family nuclease